MSNAKTIVFLETSLTQPEATEILPYAMYRPSVKKGDVIRAIKDGYTCIAIIDGNFGWTPAVWHKEILLALDYGIEVFGASSMGALRAAELDVYGMQGVGIVYDLYKTGIIDGDDEVAIAYSAHFNEQTVPLINIRFTLDQLELQFQLQFESKETIFQLIKTIYYAERTWNKIAEILPANIYHLIYENYIDIKKQDALLLLKTIKKHPVIQNKVRQNIQEREFTLFEKYLIESVVNSAITNDSMSESESEYEYEPGSESGSEKNGNFGQLIRAKNIIKLLSITKTRNNLLYYQQLMNQIDRQKYTITQVELMDQVGLFREENHLLLGDEFKLWLINKYLLNCNLQVLFTDYIKLKKYFFVSYNYNKYF